MVQIKNNNQRLGEKEIMIRGCQKKTDPSGAKSSEGFRKTRTVYENWYHATPMIISRPLRQSDWAFFV